MSSRMKYGSLSRSFGKLLAASGGGSSSASLASGSTTSLNITKKELKSKPSKKKLLSDEVTSELTNGLKKLSASRYHHLFPLYSSCYLELETDRLFACLFVLVFVFCLDKQEHLARPCPLDQLH